jgi:hypothetical protein
MRIIRHGALACVLYMAFVCPRVGACIYAYLKYGVIL